MSNTARKFKGKTWVNVTMPWGLHPRTGHRLLCADGVIRAAELAPTADTFFSVPASIRIKGKSISGYATVEENSSGNPVYAFRHHTDQNTSLPEWPSYPDPVRQQIINAAFQS